MPASQYFTQARALANDLGPGKERRLQNSELREIFGVPRITALQREEIVRALEQAGLEVVSGATSQPLIVRNAAAEGARAAVAGSRPWFKRKRTWAIAAVMFFVLMAALGSEDNASEQAAEITTQTAPIDATVTSETETTPAQAAPTRSDIEDMVEDDLYAEALAAAALLGEDDENYIARRIANRLARRTMFALDQGDRSRARFLVIKSRDYPSTRMSEQARSAYESAQAAAKAEAAARRAEAERVAQEEAAREAAQRAAEAVPDYEAPGPSAPEASGPSTTNWCGKRDGDGDGIYCE